MKNTGNRSETEILRQKAEALLKKKSIRTGSQLSEIETKKLIHELEVHQIELELQNEEVLLAKGLATIAAEKYTELYDFAPTGYFTLSQDYKIIELNLSGASLLGKEPSRLKNSQFGFFVSTDTRPIFNLFLRKVFNSKAKETCEVTLSINGNLPIYVHLIGIVIENGEQCLVIVVNITESKLAAEMIASGLAKFPSENPDPVLRVGLNGQLLYANEASYKFLTWKLQIGKKVPSVLQKTIAGAVKEGIGKIIDTEQYQRIISFNIVPIVEAG